MDNIGQQAASVNAGPNQGNDERVRVYRYPRQVVVSQPTNLQSIQRGGVNSQQTGEMRDWHQHVCNFCGNGGICCTTYCCEEITLSGIGCYGNQRKTLAAILVTTLLIYGSIAPMVAPVFAYGMYSNLSEYEVRIMFGVFIVILFVAVVTRLALMVLLRKRIKNQYNIPWDGCSQEFFTVLFCYQCTICQMMAEVDYQNQLIGRETMFG
ncbi:uncharacterized protein LOC142351799 isoform X2 [Convolutriloba macropyga]|uniref:uncharacterized protein LOC142351799 isoform X2 n=1 Tax=Convolutriloba macropyga TaxID=536237 RepID=UPI003F526C89